jgi:hypothetical protein
MFEVCSIWGLYEEIPYRRPSPLCLNGWGPCPEFLFFFLGPAALTVLYTDATASLLAEVDAQRGSYGDATARMDPGEIIFVVIIFFFL